jgi:hypothetical protein
MQPGTISSSAQGLKTMSFRGILQGLAAKSSLTKRFHEKARSTPRGAQKPWKSKVGQRVKTNP